MAPTSRILVQGCVSVDSMRDTICEIMRRNEMDDRTTDDEYIMATKYYKAPIRFEFEETAAADYEAMILIINGKSALPTLENIMDSVECRLCLVNEPIPDAFKSELLEWCMDFGFECIFTTADETSLDELMGFDRAYEALQCTMWKSMETIDNPDNVEKPEQNEEEECEFEKMLSNMQQMRQELQTLPDDKRRERAADMAMRLMEMLELEDNE